MNDVKANSKVLQVIVHAVACELGKLTSTAWKVVVDPECLHYVTLEGTGGGSDRKLVLSVAYYGPGNDGKLRAFGKFDGYVEGKQVWWADEGKNPAAFISMKKTPAQIALDIHRRVLPGYLPLLAECEARKSSYITHNSAVFEIASNFASEYGGDVNVKRDPSRPEVNFYRGKDFGGIFPDLHVNNANEVSFDCLSVSPDVAHKILALLKREASGEPTVGPWGAE